MVVVVVVVVVVLVVVVVPVFVVVVLVVVVVVVVVLVVVVVSAVVVVVVVVVTPSVGNGLPTISHVDLDLGSRILHIKPRIQDPGNRVQAPGSLTVPAVPNDKTQ